MKWSQPWSWGWCREEERCWSQRFEKASVCRQDASSQCGETDRLVETLDWSWIDGSIKKMVNQHFDINLCLGWSPVGAISSVPEPCFEKPSGSLQGKRCKIIFNSSVCFWEMRIVTLYQAVLVLEVSPQVMMNHHFVVPLTMDHLCAKVNTGNYIVGNFTLLLRGRKIRWFRRSSRSLWLLRISSNVWEVGESSW